MVQHVIVEADQRPLKTKKLGFQQPINLLPPIFYSQAIFWEGGIFFRCLHVEYQTLIIYLIHINYF